MSKITAKVWPIAFSLAIAISACGTVQGNAPGRARVTAPTTYDTIHLDAGTVTDTTTGGGPAYIEDNSSGPQLVP
jgi:hypothetical protein